MVATLQAATGASALDVGRARCTPAGHQFHRPASCSSAGPSTITPAHGYEDGDAYELTRLGPTQLSVRLDWDGSADLDLFVFEGQGEKLIARSTTRAAGAVERLTFPPSARDYMIWVAAAEGSTGLPQAYELTVCGEGVGL